MRAIAICGVLAACGQPDATVTARARPGAPQATAAAEPVAAAAPPGPRLAAGVAPVAYDLTLELDPDRASFAGRIAISISITGPRTTRLWLHAVDLDIASARLRSAGRDEPVAVLPGGAGTEMRGFALPRPVDGTVTLVIDYTGRVSDPGGRAGKQEGLFRERAGGRWYLYSQAESIFARRIAPCFDEPRFKPAWRVTAIVPRGLTALGNAAIALDRDRSDGRREVRFAEIRALPSYLFAVAVGPFELVDAGRLGRGRIPARIAVAAGEGARAARAARELPGIVDALERYVDAPLPLAKLDLVAVPEFFGAMENPGLLMFQAAMLVGDRGFAQVAAHELAHQWFGNSVTPAWWDHLWLSEGFASWLGLRVAGPLGAGRDALWAHQVRSLALEADSAIDAGAVIHPIAAPGDIEPAFDPIAYDKAAAVIAMFEGFVGPAAFQAAVRSYLAGHAGSSVTSQAFFDALAAATRPAVAEALASNLDHAGTPVVELALRCGPAPAVASVVASVAGGAVVPVCLRFPAAANQPARICFLAGPRTEQPLPAGCPAWLVGNDGGLGYYRTAWSGAPWFAEPAALSPDERLARGDDVAIAVQRGELPIGDALAEITALADTRELYGELAALDIARALDPLIADAVRPAWAAWLAARLADRMARDALLEPRSAAEFIARGAIAELARDAIDPAVVAVLRTRLDRMADLADVPIQIRIAAGLRGGPLFDRLVRGAAAARAEDARGAALEALGEFPAAYASRVVDTLLDPRFSADRVWPALAAMLARGESRSAAWRAIHARFGVVFGALTGPAARDALAAFAALCDAGARAELAADAAAVAAAIGDGRRVLDRTLAAIDRCAARRAAAGDIAAALAPGPARRAGLGQRAAASGSR